MYRVFVDEQIDEGQTGIVSIEGAEALYAEDGSLLTDPKIQVINLNSASLQSGDRGLAYYDTVACEYIFIGGGGGGLGGCGGGIGGQGGGGGNGFASITIDSATVGGNGGVVGTIKIEKV